MFIKIIKSTLAVVLCIILFIGLFLAYLTVKNPKHEPIETLTIENQKSKKIEIGKPITLTTFNIGYGGLGKDADFFADGGKSSRAISVDTVEKNLVAIEHYIKQNNADIYLLQEVDVKSSRSYDINQLERLKALLPQHESAFAYNYNATWVPVPLFNPMGYANSGLLTFSKYQMSAASRHALKGQESWPVILAELDRCFTEHVIPVDTNRNLYVINLHLSAYDKGGALREQQIQHVKAYMVSKYQEGHYVILGGDYNQQLNLSQMNDPEFMKNWPEWLQTIPKDLVETGFQLAYDPNQTTVRDLKTAYVKGETFEATIDGFLVSPNINIVEIKGHPLEFTNSDHNPVSITITLKP